MIITRIFLKKTRKAGGQVQKFQWSHGSRWMNRSVGERRKYTRKHSHIHAKAAWDKSTFSISNIKSEDSQIENAPALTEFFLPSFFLSLLDEFITFTAVQFSSFSSHLTGQPFLVSFSGSFSNSSLPCIWMLACPGLSPPAPLLCLCSCPRGSGPMGPLKRPSPSHDLSLDSTLQHHSASPLEGAFSLTV